MIARVLALVLLGVVGIGGIGAYRLLWAGIALEVYGERLRQLSGDYEALRRDYNDAVRKTAVTELLVEGGALSVVIRTIDGEVQRLSSPFDPSREIYVDYVMQDGRLWIRRVFDEDTPPGLGMTIDPRFVDVDWESDAAAYGKAAYRKLGEGRWIVTVTGDGSLGLARGPEREPVELSSPPPIRSFAPVREEIADAMRDLSFAEVVGVLARPLGGEAGEGWSGLPDWSQWGRGGGEGG